MKCPTLNRAWQFELVYSQGRKRTCRALVLFYLASAGDNRVAYVASRKVGGAVARNRAKRLMRVAFRQVLERAPAARGWLVMVARRDIARLKSRQVEEHLRGLLEEFQTESEPPPS